MAFDILLHNVHWSGNSPRKPGSHLLTIPSPLGRMSLPRYPITYMQTTQAGARYRRTIIINMPSVQEAAKLDKVGRMIFSEAKRWELGRGCVCQVPTTVMHPKHRGPGSMIFLVVCSADQATIHQCNPPNSTPGSRWASGLGKLGNPGSPGKIEILNTTLGENSM